MKLPQRPNYLFVKQQNFSGICKSAELFKFVAIATNPILSLPKLGFLLIKGY